MLDLEMLVVVLLGCVVGIVVSVVLYGLLLLFVVVDWWGLVGLFLYVVV